MVTLNKERYSCSSETGEQWDIDVFYTHEEWQADYRAEPYCILAECEMEGDVIVPSRLPCVVAKNLVHAVRPGDKAFGSKSIADFDKTTQILKVLLDLHRARNA